jgi:hypothetical protein
MKQQRKPEISFNVQRLCNEAKTMQISLTGQLEEMLTP